MKPEVVAGIFARGGSKGVLRKNIRPLAGRPLIGYAIETALSSKLIDRVVVSTDDPEIAEVSRQCGAEIPFMRPADLARDDSPEWLAWQHAVRMLNSESNGSGVGVLVCLPATAPLRAVEDVDACIRALDGATDLVITVKRADRNPYFNMVVLDARGYARPAIETEEPLHQRQAAPAVYDMTTVAYAAWPNYVLRATSMFDGRVKAVVVPTERALDIDTEFDLQLAGFLLGKRGAK